MNLAGQEGRREQGFVLVMVLVLIAFMAFAMGTFSSWVNKELALSKALKARMETEVAAFSVKQNFLYLLSKGSLKSPRGLDFKYKNGKIPEGEDEEDEVSYLALHDKDYVTDQFELRLQDEGGLLHLQKLSDAEKKRLLSLFDVEESDMEGFIAKLKDYVSPNPTGTASSLGGASPSDYKEAGLPPPPFKPLRTPWEIKRVLGWRDHEPFFENDALPKIITTSGSGKVNLNTAPAMILDFVKDMTPEIKAFLLEKRSSETPYIQHLRDITNATGAKFPSGSTRDVFPSGTIRATITSKQIVFNRQLSVSQTLNDEKIPWRINYEIELASPPPMVRRQVDESEDDAESELQQSVFPDPALLFANDKGSRSS